MVLVVMVVVVVVVVVSRLADEKVRGGVAMEETVKEPGGQSVCVCVFVSALS